MQLYAFHPDGTPTFANRAAKQQNYFCAECKTLVRLRGGLHRQNHFYHLDSSRQCRQNAKSLEHLNTQLYFLEVLPQGACVLEQSFPAIHRIADVVWEAEKIIFEIQCSPISSEEIKERNRDYASLGYTVIWILHDKRYNQRRLAGAELSLDGTTHYFTNISDQGEGIVYDQFSLLEGGFRYPCFEKLPLDVTGIKRFQDRTPEFPLALVKTRKQHSSGSGIYFAGDLTDSHFSDDPKIQCYLQEARKVEHARMQREEKRGSMLSFCLYEFLIRPYNLLFQMLLERACKS